MTLHLSEANSHFAIPMESKRATVEFTEDTIAKALYRHPDPCKLLTRLLADRLDSAQGEIIRLIAQYDDEIFAGDFADASGTADHILKAAKLLESEALASWGAGK